MTASATSISSPLTGISYAGGESLVSKVWSGISGFVRLDVQDDEVVTPRELSLPDWVFPALAQLIALQRLPKNWDSYDGLPLKPQHSEVALRFLGLVMADGIELPDIVPLADGGVQLEWRPEGVDVDFISDEEVPEPTVYITRGGETEELSETRAVGYFLDGLRELLRGREAAAV